MMTSVRNVLSFDSTRDRDLQLFLFDHFNILLFVLFITEKQNFNTNCQRTLLNIKVIWRSRSWCYMILV